MKMKMKMEVEEIFEVRIKKISEILILIDNGHGYDTPGKCSPDGSFKEFAYNREIAAKVVSELQKRGYNARLLVPELHDISLKERVNRVNKECKALGKNNVLLISIHVNAAGNGNWMSARGWSCYTTEGETESDKVAEHLYNAAERLFVGHKIRKDYSDGDRDWEKAFYICRKTLCPAVLVENFFMDNKDDLAYLISDEGKNAIVNCHVDGVISYLKSKK